MHVRYELDDQPQEPAALTEAETQVLPLLPTHLTLSAIAERLGVQRSTVKTHVAHIYKKFGVTSRAKAVERAEAGDLLDVTWASTHRRRVHPPSR
jgi:DNA-binding NarL/FixJ family response regulator